MTESNVLRVSKLDWLTSLRGAELTHAEFRVLVILGTFANAELRNAYPSNDRLQRDAGVSRNALKQALKSLRAKGFISIEFRGGNQHGKGRANVHRIIPKPPTEWSPSPGQGDHSVVPLTDPQGDHSVTPRGPLSVHEGDHSVVPHQVIDPAIDQVSPSSHVSNAQAPASNRFASDWMDGSRRSAADEETAAVAVRSKTSEVITTSHASGIDTIDVLDSTASPLVWIESEIPQGFQIGERERATALLATGMEAGPVRYQLIRERAQNRKRRTA